MQRIQEYLYNTVKGDGYYRHYEQLFAALREKPVTLMEVGVQAGGCLELWRDWFPNGQIIGLDKDTITLNGSMERIRLYQGLQEDIPLLDRIAAESAPNGFDIVIDDASHIAAHARVTFWHLFKYHMKAGALYIVEDWGTGYRDYWPDGSPYLGTNHFSGMVGFIKELIDEVASPDRLSHNDPFLGGKPSYIKSMQVIRGMAILERSDAP